MKEDIGPLLLWYLVAIEFKSLDFLMRFPFLAN